MLMNEELREEVEALMSIYSDCIQVRPDESNATTTVNYIDNVLNYTISFTIPATYPQQAHPNFDMSFRQKLDAGKKAQVIDSMRDVIAEAAGEVVLFTVIEKARELMESNTVQDEFDAEAESIDDLYALRTQQEQPATAATISVIHGPIMVEQKSSFQAHIAEVHSMNDVLQFKQAVLSDKRVARATHNIFAFRFTCIKGTGVVYHDCDDDGETAAAGRLAEMIRLMGIDGVAVIVSRWFGGILLGPDRFKFICNSARNLLEDNGYGNSSERKKA
jgi:hypothetical protein